MAELDHLARDGVLHAVSDMDVTARTSILTNGGCWPLPFYLPARRLRVGGKRVSGLSSARFRFLGHRRYSDRLDDQPCYYITQDIDWQKDFNSRGTR